MREPSVTHNTFVIERRYATTPERVFAFFADPAKKRRWLGGEAEGFAIESFVPNFQVDSLERWTFRFKGGELIKNDVCYQDIVPQRRIVFVYTMTFGDKRVSSSQTTVELIPTDGGTKLIHTEQGAFFDSVDSARGREEGTRGLLEQLAKELERAS
ncbi:MAG TPA: SRPBCC family protein [Candidatus Saccharimonadales bacterium]|nr:SRPBCC family protein [Candidatus Saccharimonadales bacterium]